MRTLLITLFLLAGLVLNATNYYVKTGGNDANTGLSDAQAWLTITKVNAVWAAGTFAPGDSILFNKGDTFTGTITVTESGVAGNPIVISAYGTGNKPIITNFETITGWADEGSGIYSKVTAISPETSPNVVTLDGVNTAMGKWPNAGWMYYESRSGTTSITDNELTASPDWTGAQLVFHPNAWMIQRRTISNHTNSTLTYSGGSVSTPSVNYGYFIQKDIRTLDDLGDWYFDDALGELYMYFGAVDPTTKTVKIVVRDRLISITGYNYITIDDLDLEGTNTYGVYLSNAKYIVIQNSEINFIGNSGVYATSASNNCTVNNNTISNVQGIGVDMSGTGCTYAAITNNTINNIGLLAGMTPHHWGNMGISMYGGNSNAEYNFISNVGYIGIFFRASNMTVNKNFVNYAGMVKDDGSGIYTGLTGSFTGMSITNNIVLNGGVGAATKGVPYSFVNIHGIYLDYGGGAVTVSGNSVANNRHSGIMMHSTADNIIKSNLSYNNVYFQIYQAYSSGLGVIHDNQITENRFVAKPSSNQWAYSFKNMGSNGGMLDSLDYNIYARPVNDDKPFYFYPAVDLKYYMTLAEWQTYSGEDVYSTKSPVGVADTTEIDLYYNASLVADSVFTLPYASVDLEGTKYATEITLQSFEAVILLKDPNPDPAPPDPAVVTTMTRLEWEVYPCGARGGGEVTSAGGGTVSARGVCYNTTGSPTTADSKTTDGSGTGSFVSEMTLDIGETYYVRAYATNEVGTSYGLEVSFNVPSQTYMIMSVGAIILVHDGKILYVE